MRLHRFLLRLYPASFRREYGTGLRDAFERRLRASPNGATTAGLWLQEILDTLRDAAAAHGDLLRQDLSVAARGLRRAPGFALTAVLVTALGVGANTAAFSVADFVMLRPLPFPEPDRLVRLWEAPPGYGQMELSPPNYRDWKRLATSFAGMGAFHATAANLLGEGTPRRVSGVVVTKDLLPLLGVGPAQGRLFGAEDPGDGWVVLSHALWQDAFGGSREVVGRTVTLDGVPRVVVGVMPRDFRFPSARTEYWQAMGEDELAGEDRTDNYFEVVARLAPGVTLERARAELSVVAKDLERQYPTENARIGANVFRVRDGFSNESRLLLLGLCGAALCVLLIACANLANLLLARGLVRHRELVVRTALGAGRERLVRQLVTESLVLAVLGGVLGIAVAAAAVPALARLVPTSLPIARAPGVDLRILAFAGLLTALTGIAFGVFPALRASRAGALGALREGVRAGGGRGTRLRSALVVVEVMASVVLLVASGLLMRALWRVQDTDPGFRAERTLTLQTALPWPRYAPTERRVRFYDEVIERVRALPGVDAAAYISFLPMTMTGGIWPVSLRGDGAVRVQDQVASARFVTPGFFGAMGIPLARGRDVASTDRLDGLMVAVVSASFARRYWPDQDPLGKTFRFAFADRTVVGIAADVRVRGLERSSEPQVYLPYTQQPDSAFSFYQPKDLVVRTAGDPMAVLPAVRRIVAEVDPDQPISAVRTLEDIVGEQTASRAAQARVVGAFALIAFLLAGVGIHGLLAFAVSSRRHEIGVRMALGARPGAIVSMVLRQAVLLAAAGVAPGIVMAWAAGTGLRALLAGVQPADGLTFGVAVGLCVVMTLAGSLVPALRAVRVAPATAFRSD